MIWNRIFCIPEAMCFLLKRWISKFALPFGKVSRLDTTVSRLDTEVSST